MANLDKLKELSRKFELKEQWAKAIEPLVKAIEEFDRAIGKLPILPEPITMIDTKEPK